MLVSTPQIRALHGCTVRQLYDTSVGFHLCRTGRLQKTAQGPTYGRACAHRQGLVWMYSHQIKCNVLSAAHYSCTAVLLIVTRLKQTAVKVDQPKKSLSTTSMQSARTSCCMLYAVPAVCCTAVCCTCCTLYSCILYAVYSDTA